MLVGVAVLLIGDRIVERRFGTSGAGGAMGIVVGSVVGGALGYLVADLGSDIAGSRMAALAAGGLLAMLRTN